MLRWMAAREDVLRVCIERDLSQRDLADIERLKATNEDTGAPVLRLILAELLHRGLRLHRFAMKHGSIMAEEAKTTPTELLADAQAAIADPLTSDALLELVGLTREELMDSDRNDWPYTKLIARHFNTEDREHELADFHLSVSTRMATHLALTVEHFMTAEYRAAGIHNI